MMVVFIKFYYALVFIQGEDVLSEDNVETYFRNELYSNYNFALVFARRGCVIRG